MRVSAQQLAFAFAYDQSFAKQIKPTVEGDKPDSKVALERSNPNIHEELPPIYLTREIVHTPSDTEEATVALSTMLYYSLGLLRREGVGSYNDHRGVPSPRSLYATRAYIVLPPHHTWGEGVYLYEPMQHALMPIGLSGAWGMLEQALAEQVKGIDFAVIVANRFAVFPDTYGTFKYPLGLMEVGHYIDSSLQLGEVFGYHVEFRYSFCDQVVRQYLQIGYEEGEIPVSVLLMTRDNHEHLSRLHTRSSVESDFPVIELGEDTLKSLDEACLINQSDRFLPLFKQNISKIEENGICVLNLLNYPPSSLLDRFYARNSGRGLFGISTYGAGMKRDKLEGILPLVFQTYPNDLGISSSFAIEPYVALRKVEAMEDGLYAVDPLTKRLQLRKKGNPMGILQQGFLYPSTVCNIEALSMVWLLVIDYGQVIGQYGARGYRIAQLELGRMAQQICVAAAGEGMFVRPCRSFSEAILDPYLELGGTRKVVGYELLVGENRSKDLFFDLRI